MNDAGRLVWHGEIPLFEAADRIKGGSRREDHLVALKIPLGDFEDERSEHLSLGSH